MIRPSLSPGNRKKPPGRIGNMVFGGVFLAAGLLFFVVLMSGVVESIRLRLQPAIGFRVVRTEIVPADLGRSGFNLVIHFQQPGRSETEWVELHEFDYRDLVLVQRTLPPGTPVTGRRLPADSPARLDVCEPGWRSLFLLPAVLFPLVFVFVGARSVCCAFTGRKEVSDRTAETSPWIYFAVGAILLVVGSVPVTAVGVLPLRDWVRSRDWVPTPATIEMARSSVSRSGKGGRSWHPEVLYRYAWKGELHRSSRIGLGEKSSESGTQRFVADHPVGSSTTCLVNPGDPTEALLDRSLSWWTLLSLPFGLFHVFGLLLWRAGWKARRAARGGRRAGAEARVFRPAGRSGSVA